MPNCTRPSVFTRPFLLRISGLIGVTFALLLNGCNRPVENTEYSASEKSEKASPTHREQVTAALKVFFGTPEKPRLAKPTPESTEDEEFKIATLELEDVIDGEALKNGARVFNRRCASCHGMSGDGQGEAAEYLNPKPRDYRKGVFKFTSTPYGAKPTRADLVRIIRRGAKGTSMPRFPFLPDDEVRDLVSYVIMLSCRGEVEGSTLALAEMDYDPEEAMDPIDITDVVTRTVTRWERAEYQGIIAKTAEPKYSPETVLAGRKAFLSRGCAKCHGEDFRGQMEWLDKDFIAAQEKKPESERIQVNRDAWGHVAPAADLTARMLHGGRRPIDIYRRIYTGINGTPMPAFGQALSETPDTIWHLTHYVLSVVNGDKIPGIEDVKADPPAGAGSGGAE